MVIDCANGAAYKVVPEALWELGADVISIGVEPDGFNINKECGSTSPEALSRKVREMRADIGIALDGDADRVILVDERGHVIDGDQLLAVIAQSWKEDGRLAKPGIVATVMSNLGLERFLRWPGYGAGAHAGRRSLRARTDAEPRLQSRRRAVGHIILSDYATTGDGFVAALQVLAVVQKTSPAGLGGLPSLRSTAADPEECSLSQRQAARGRRGQIGDPWPARNGSMATAGCWSAPPERSR